MILLVWETPDPDCDEAFAANNGNGNGNGALGGTTIATEVRQSSRTKSSWFTIVLLLSSFVGRR